MPTPDKLAPSPRARNKRPSKEFSAYCELEFTRRLNSGESFDEPAYRQAMALVLDRLTRLEDEDRP